MQAALQYFHVEVVNPKRCCRERSLLLLHSNADGTKMPEVLHITLKQNYTIALESSLLCTLLRHFLAAEFDSRVCLDDLRPTLGVRVDCGSVIVRQVAHMYKGCVVCRKVLEAEIQT